MGFNMELGTLMACFVVFIFACLVFYYINLFIGFFIIIVLMTFVLNKIFTKESIG